MFSFPCSPPYVKLQYCYNPQFEERRFECNGKRVKENDIFCYIFFRQKVIKKNLARYFRINTKFSPLADKTPITHFHELIRS